MIFIVALFAILCIVFWFLAAFRVPASVDWGWLGWAFAALAVTLFVLGPRLA